MSETILEIRGLNKYFGSTHANKNIDFSVKKGEVKGLIGENGSGKSTLISQIAGIYGSDTGEMILKGEKYAPKNPIDANSHGVAMVLQELGVIGTLPAGVNVFLGHTNRFSKFGIVSLKAINKAANEQFEKWNFPKIPMRKMTAGMMIEERKMLELARALACEPDILILDEVTQSLSLNNREILYDLIKKFKEMGRSVICITHDVEEMIEITDSITVLRDGEVVGNVVSAETTPEEVKNMMVGRDMSGNYYRADMTPTYDDEVVLSVSNLSIPGEIEDVSFEVHAGEILGFCGLSDSGIHSVGKGVYGLNKHATGDVVLNGKLHIHNATQALHNNCAYIPKDRDNEALMINANIRDNFCLPSVKELAGAAGYLSFGKINKLSNDMVDELSVKCQDIKQPMNALSGGNKQKVNLGRWIAKDLKLLILDCPTRGVDVGVKAYIYDLMQKIKEKNIATILISDELTEVLGMADRLAVMKDGKITKVIRRDEDFTEQSVIEVMI